MAYTTRTYAANLLSSRDDRWLFGVTTWTAAPAVPYVRRGVVQAKFSKGLGVVSRSGRPGWQICLIRAKQVICISKAKRRRHLKQNRNLKVKRNTSDTVEFKESTRIVATGQQHCS